MKAVMISIQPKWVEKITGTKYFKGYKTFEVRKKKPKIETPFKNFIYCTYGNSRENYMFGKTGMVVGEFICDKIIEIKHNFFGSYFIEDDEYTTGQVAEQSCLDFKALDKYLNGKTGYAWHISNLKIYDKPKELKKFNLERPFQSWGYVEDEE